MGWIQDYRRQSSQSSHDLQDAESQFAAAARSRWRELGDELRADVAEFNKQGTGAELAVEGEDTYRVRNSSSGLELVLKADFDNHSVSYDYAAINQRSAGVPEGGMLSMRQSRRAMWSSTLPTSGLRQKKRGRYCWSRCFFPSSRLHRF